MVKGFSVINEAEANAFLEFICFFQDPVDVCNLTSGSSAFSKSSVNIPASWEICMQVKKQWLELNMEQ